MKTQKGYILIVVLASLLSFGCATNRPLGDKDEVWVGETSNILGLFYSSEIYYCKANKTDRGSVPMCFKADKLEPKPH